MQATLALLARKGGLRIYVPTPERVTADHPMSAIIGEQALRQLAAEYGGLPHFQLPKAERALKAHPPHPTADSAACFKAPQSRESGFFYVRPPDKSDISLSKAKNKKIIAYQCIDEVGHRATSDLKMSDLSAKPASPAKPIKKASEPRFPF